jgi:hypothetical protein
LTPFSLLFNSSHEKGEREFKSPSTFLSSATLRKFPRTPVNEFKGSEVKMPSGENDEREAKREKEDDDGKGKSESI